MMSVFVFTACVLILPSSGVNWFGLTGRCSGCVQQWIVLSCMFSFCLLTSGCLSAVICFTSSPLTTCFIISSLLAAGKMWENTANCVLCTWASLVKMWRAGAYKMRRISVPSVRRLLFLEVASGGGVVLWLWMMHEVERGHDIKTTHSKLGVE